MRTMPSDTEVTVPSLRASAASLTFSMRLLISSLISDGLSVCMGVSLGRPAGAGAWFKGKSSSVRQYRAEARQLGPQRAVDHRVAGVDHRAADQALVDRRGQLDLAAEALAQRGAQLLQLVGGQRLGRGDRGLDHLLGLGAQLVV